MWIKESDSVYYLVKILTPFTIKFIVFFDGQRFGDWADTLEIVFADLKIKNKLTFNYYV